ncbi:MAG: hypothetical protein ACRDGN_03170 [bacterium]
MPRGVLLDVKAMACLIDETQNAVYKKATHLPGYVKVKGRVRFRLVDLVERGWVPADWLSDAKDLLRSR